MWGFESPLSHFMTESRYSRQTVLHHIGEEGQSRLEAATVAVVGLGATGGAAAELLARIGIGTLILIDRDVVEESNLPRQTLFNNQDSTTSASKAEAAAQSLQATGLNQSFIAKAADLNHSNAKSLLRDAELIIDGTDNFHTRYLLNDYSIAQNIPWLYMGAVGTWGITGLVVPPGPCLRCTWPLPPQTGQAATCSTAGIIASASTAIAALGVTEAVKWILKKDEDLLKGFAHIDIWSHEHRSLTATKDPACPCCVDHELPWLNGDNTDSEAETLCGGDSVQIPVLSGPINLERLAARLNPQCKPTKQGDTLRFETRNCEIVIFEDGRALIRGTRDPALAKSILAETIGV